MLHGPQQLSYSVALVELGRAADETVVRHDVRVHPLLLHPVQRREGPRHVPRLGQRMNQRVVGHHVGVDPQAGELVEELDGQAQVHLGSSAHERAQRHHVGPHVAREHALVRGAGAGHVAAVAQHADELVAVLHAGEGELNCALKDAQRPRWHLPPPRPLSARSPSESRPKCGFCGRKWPIPAAKIRVGAPRTREVAPPAAAAAAAPLSCQSTAAERAAALAVCGQRRNTEKPSGARAVRTSDRDQRR
eukprot:scaffold1696_cov258-Pinguiococcus_pyrenoidosus.AAC.35